jgi:alpha-ribazole phosphatase
MGGTFTLHLIRHASTAGNAARQYIGWTDETIVPFEAEGFSGILDVWGSDMQRCRQTAEILFPSAVYHADPNWRECHFGEWEQKTYAQLEQIQEYRNWIDDPFKWTPPGGESMERLSMRVEQAVLELPKGTEFIVVTHGGPIRYLIARGKREAFRGQIALHGHCHTLVWESRQAFKEGAPCISFSVEPLMANANM